MDDGVRGCPIVAPRKSGFRRTQLLKIALYERICGSDLDLLQGGHYAQRARRMVALRQCILICALQKTTAFSQPASMRTRSAATSLRSGATGELKDYAGAAGGLFGTYRIPASLFAGASAGAAFAMPILAGEAATLGSVVSANNNNLHAIDATAPFPQVREAHLRRAHDQLAGLPITSHRRQYGSARTPVTSVRQGSVRRGLHEAVLRSRMDRRATQLLRGSAELCHRDRSEGEGLCRNQNVNAPHAIDAMLHTHRRGKL